ncbi:DNA polymerase III subunit delta' [Ghiorsea bivora]|uniref:DNA polymerase III subunit delta' n=1 Tax=Ghiorsea bivora TaxID=1485545 RepID=UPI00056EADF5|nr:DNA polymerase III subunit delta' [Ghiorsea bivora]
MNKILGHEHVQNTFAEAVQQGRLHHAWLLYGVKGIGKASVAEQLAALFLCERPSQGQACGQCHHCAMLHAGSHPDFSKVSLLYDAKKKKFNRDINIAQTREALDFLALSGLKSKRRVLMIDDANFMNNQAANALLKGLEEPTEGSLLLIVCHDLTRLPTTIRSRCMLQACAPLDPEQMQTVLKARGFDQELHALATELGQGSLGRIEVLQEDSQAKALLTWQGLVEDLAKSDIGRIQQWLDSHVKNIPHDLIASVVLLAAQKQALQLTSWQQSDAMFTAMQAVAKWPKEVVMHTLRPAPALLSYILQLRGALKSG